MMYTILDTNEIFGEWEEFEPQYDTLELIDGVKIKVERLNNEEARIIQIISSNPQHYLNANLTPGKLVKYKLQLE